jgi:hypothetical protein
MFSAFFIQDTKVARGLDQNGACECMTDMGELTAEYLFSEFNFILGYLCVSCYYPSCFLAVSLKQWGNQP